MKKVIFLLMFLGAALFSVAQPGSLDTANIRNFTAKGSEWAYYISYLNGTNDSSDIVFIREVRAKLRSTQNLTWNTNVTLDSIRGKYVVAIYDIGRRIPAGEAIQLGVTVLNTISAITHPVIQYYVGAIDSQYSNEFIRHRTLGKNILID